MPAPAPSHVGGTQLIGTGCLFWIALAQSLRGSGGGRSAVAISLLLAAAVGGVRYQAVTHLLPVDHVDRVGLFGAEVVIRGRVAEEPERREGKNRFALSLETQGVAGGIGDGEEQVVSGKVLVTLVHGLAAELGYGARLPLRGRLLRPQPARNPSAFDYRQFLAVRDIHATISVRRPEQILRIEPRLGRGVRDRGHGGDGSGGLPCTSCHPLRGEEGGGYLRWNT